MSDEELLKNHFESGEEMIKRNMVGAEIWKTGDGVITNGTREAREAILNIYRDPESGFQQLLDECSAKAAKTATTLRVTQHLDPLQCLNLQSWTGLYR